jgi:hypothetical protein
MLNGVIIIFNVLFLSLLYFKTTAQYYNRIDDIFKSDKSSYFGFDSGYQPKNNLTRYQIKQPKGNNTDDLTQAWFDISNNNIIASADANGLIEYPTVLGPLKNFQNSNFTDADYITGSQWTFSLKFGNKSVLFTEIENPTLEIIQNVFLKWIYHFKDLKIELIYFAPEAQGNPMLPEPRGIICLVKLDNLGRDVLEGKIILPEKMRNSDNLLPESEKAIIYGSAAMPIADSHKGDSSNFHPRFAEVAPVIAGYEAFVTLENFEKANNYTECSFKLNPGEDKIISGAFIVGASDDELRFTRDFIRSKSVISWFNSTLAIHKKATGKLVIPEDPLLTEMFYRYYECGHSCYLLSGSGNLTEPKGGAWSIMSILNPEYVKETIINKDYVSGMVPFYADAVEKDVSFSLYGSTIDFIMMADYYQRTGVIDLLNTPDYRSKATSRINSILDSRYPDVTLFPSRQIWDGPSRGDYHTGSQILVWRVLDMFSRIADEVWEDKLHAKIWSEAAVNCRSDIFKKCVIDGPFGQQFAEGTWRNGNIDEAAKCHDGEEVAIVQAAFYGFVEQDNPLIINHCKASMTPFNFLYNPDLRAMMWQGYPDWNGGYTFPAWLVLISGAETKKDFINAFDFWKSRTDIDGSPWWWPYDVGQTDILKVNRRKSNYDGGFCDVAKVSYATSVFNTLLINNILGLSADLPQNKVIFKPLSPWSKFEWLDGRIGNSFFDISYLDNGEKISICITNKNQESFKGILGITVPENMELNDKLNKNKRYGRDYAEVEKELKPGQKEVFTIEYQPKIN